MFASRFSWLMVVKEERRFTGRARVLSAQPRQRDMQENYRSAEQYPVLPGN